MKNKLKNTGRLKKIGVLVSILLTSGMLQIAEAGPREQAKRMHDRLVGVPPTETVLTSMAAKIQSGDTVGAAEEAMSNKLFYNSTLKNFVTPWTNEALTPFADLNDYTATVIGMIRDDVPFNQVLTADLVYIGAPGIATAYSQTNNQNYIDLQTKNIDLSDPTNLIPTTQSGLPDSQLTPEAAAGVLTSRAAAAAFLRAGTNRRAWRFTAINYLCHDMEDLNDNTRPTDRIRQDVSRSPGGDSKIFLNSCSGCHSGMDSLTQAFAYYNYDETAGRLVYTPDQVQAKFLINSSNFPHGYITTDDHWDNYWRKGPNAVLGWRGDVSGGNGLKSMGTEVANSRAFSQCQVKKVFKSICFRSPLSVQDQTQVEKIADTFESDNYNMKRVFADVAVYCMGN